MSMQQLLKDIEENRKEMVTLASRFSFLDENVLKASDRLDQLIMQYYALSGLKKQ